MFDSIYEVLSSRSLAELLVSERIQEFCARECLFVCGAGAAGPHSSWCEHMKSILESILPHCNTPTFLCFELDGLQKRSVAAFELSEGDVLQVTPSFAKAPKEEIYNCIWEGDLANNPLQKLMTKVCQAVVASTTAQVPAGTQAPLQEYFRRVEVPADGLCGWHCINAIGNLEAWEAIPRNAGHHAVNRAVQKSEETKALELCAKVCSKARQQGFSKVVSQHIERVSQSPNFSVGDLHWIAAVLDTAIRCTVDPKVGLPQLIGFDLLYIYIHFFNSIQVQSKKYIYK